MLLAPKQEQLDQWSQSLHSYEKSKRTKHPFGRKQPELDQNLKTQIVDK